MMRGGKRVTDVMQQKICNLPCYGSEVCLMRKIAGAHGTAIKQRNKTTRANHLTKLWTDRGGTVNGQVMMAVMLEIFISALILQNIFSNILKFRFSIIF